MSHLGSFRIGIEIQLSHLGGPRKAAGTTYGNRCGLFYPRGTRNRLSAGGNPSMLARAGTNGLARPEIGRPNISRQRYAEHANLNPRRTNLLSDRRIVHKEPTRRAHGRFRKGLKAGPRI